MTHQIFMVPTPTRKMGEYFVVEEKSGNFEQTGKIYTGKFRNFAQNSGKLGNFYTIYIFSVI